MGKTYFLSPYLIMNGIGFAVGLLLLDQKIKDTFNKDQTKIYMIFVLSIMGGWIGAHIFDALVKNQPLNYAGFTFYGGLIFGSISFIFLFVKYCNKEDLITAINIGVKPLVLGHAIGRISCFFSGCCYGKIIEYPKFLSLFFKRHPTQIYEACFLFILFLFLTIKEKIKIKAYISDVYIYLISYAIFRFFIEFLRGDYRGQYLNGLSPSQWISLLIIISLFIHYITVFFLKVRRV